jgi:starvation-inducible DNA-binding protein
MRLQALNSSQLRVTRNELPQDIRRPVIESMNGILAEIIDVSLAARHAHWNVRGRSFSAMHELFGRLHTTLDQHADEIAERIAALGGIARGTVQGVAAETALDPYPTLASSDLEHIDALAERLGQLGTAMRHAIDECGRLNDPISVHHLTEAAADVDKLLWLVESNSGKSG